MPRKNDRPELSDTIDSIGTILRNAESFTAAVAQSLEALCEHSPVAFGHARIHLDTAGDPDAYTPDLWHSALPDRRSDPVRKAIESNPALAPGRAGESGCRHVHLAGTDVDAVEGAARKAGLSSVVYLDIEAEGRPAASVQLFSERKLTDGDELISLLTLLAGQLGRVAGQARMKRAVRVAARHGRRQVAELARLEGQVESTETKIRKLQTELGELEAQNQIRAYRSRRSDESRDVRSVEDPPPAEPVVDPTFPTSGSTGTGDPGPESRLYDARTELPRRAIFEDRIEQAIRRRQRSPKHLFAVLAVSADGLEKVMLDSGTEGLDVVTTALSRRLLAQVRSADTVAHLDTATFGLVLEEIHVLDEAVRIAERIVKELQRPIWSGSSETVLGVRVGIVFGGPAYERARSVIRDSVAALTRSQSNRTSVAVFDDAAQHEEEIRRRIEVQLGQALSTDQLSLEYQPIVSLQDGRISGIEAYLRWRHPEYGMIPPDQFIPIAAQSPLIHDLGVWILERACEQVTSWQKSLSRPVPTIDINVTAQQLFHERTAGRVRSIIERHGLNCAQFRFDIPESDLMENPATVSTALRAIRDLGCQIVIDDFGTSFSSLRQLHSLPIDALKIDRSFISGGRDDDSLAIARTIVQLANSLDAEVIAEGVETRDQFRFLRSIGCGNAQGYLFSAPVKPARIVELIREGYPLAQALRG